MRILVRCIASLLGGILGATALPAATVWSGPPVTFTKAEHADPALPESQDRISTDVWITRGNTRGLYNIKTEAVFVDKTVSPAGTRWAFLGVGDNPVDPAVFNASNHAALTFDAFATALGGQVGHVVVGRKGVLHLVAQDVYLDIVFSSWTMAAGGGGFSYTRSTGAAETADVPLLPPWAMILLGAVLACVAVPFLPRHVPASPPH